MSEPLIVAWTVLNSPYHVDDYEDWVPVAITHRGRVLDSVRRWGATLLVVACDDGRVREVSINEVRIAKFKAPNENAIQPRSGATVEESAKPSQEAKSTDTPQ